MTHGSRAQEDNPGTLSKHRRWQQFRVTNPSTSVCWNWFSLRTAELYISCFFPYTSLGQSRIRWSGYIVLKIKRRADILEIWGELCCCALIDVRICPLIDILQLPTCPQLDSASPARQNAHMMIILEMKNAAACSPVHKKSSQKFLLIKSSPLCHDIAAPVMSSSPLSSLLPSIL